MSNIDMAHLHHWTLSWADTMLHASWQGGLLILAVWISCRMMPRLPACLRCCLWWLACLKLLVGVVWISPVPLALLPATSPHRTTSQRSTYHRRTAPDVSRPARASQNRTVPAAHHGRIRHRRPSPAARSLFAHMRPAAVESLYHHTPVTGLHSAIERKLESRAAITAIRTDARSRHIPIMFLLLGLWLAGVLGRGTIVAGQALIVRRLVRQSRWGGQKEVQKEALEVAVALRMCRLPQIRFCNQISSPMMAGLLSPVVLLPRPDRTRLSEMEVSAVLAHEFAHVQRGDLWLGLVPLLAETLFFFHPLVWLASREFALAREEACDAEAMRVTGAPAHLYGLLLLKLCAAGRHTGAALGIESNYRTLKRRLAMLQHVTVLSRGRRLGWGSLLAAVGVACLVPWQIVAMQPAVKAEASRLEPLRRTARSNRPHRALHIAKAAQGEPPFNSRSQQNGLALLRAYGQPKPAIRPGSLPIITLSQWRRAAPSARPAAALAADRITTAFESPSEADRVRLVRNNVTDTMDAQESRRPTRSEGSDLQSNSSDMVNGTEDRPSTPPLPSGSPSPLSHRIAVLSSADKAGSQAESLAMPVSKSKITADRSKITADKAKFIADRAMYHQQQVEEFALARKGARKLRIDIPRGSIVVFGRADQIQIHAEIECETGDAVTLQNMQHRSYLVHRREGDTLVVEPKPNHDFAASGSSVTSFVVVRMPRDMGLIAHIGNGPIDVQGVEEAQLHSGGGAIGAYDIRGRVGAETGWGNITVELCGGPVRAKSGNGGIVVKKVQGKVKAHSEAGALFVDGCAGDVDTSTGAGEIIIHRAQGAIKAKSGFGRIAVELDALHSGDKVALKTSQGDISLLLPQAVSAHLDAHTRFSHIEIAPELQAHLVRSGETSFSGDHLVGDLGNGGSELNLSNSTGLIHIGLMQSARL